MRKTILKHFSDINNRATEETMDVDMKREQLTDLVQEMKPYLAEAEADLLQPRPEALAALFKKALS